MASATSIANGALIKLGQDLINAITDTNSKAARICNERLPNARQVVLNSAPFNGSVKRVTLASTVNTPEFFYTNEFQLPSDCLTLITVEPQYKDTDYALEGDKILYSGTELNIIYVADIANDYNKVDPLVQEAISAYLAKDIAYIITNDNQTANRMEEIYERTLRKAISRNNKQLKRLTFEGTDWLDARLVGGYPSTYPKVN